jgi:ABC-type transporter Mla subunit MlaD
VDSPLSRQTSEQVQRILEAAERSAAELRAAAGREAADQVGRVAEAARGVLARVAELERDLEALRRGAERLSAGLAELQARLERESAGADSLSSSPGGELTAAPAPADPLPEPAADGDEAGARLIALNMALSGSPREDTARYLTDHFGLAAPESLLDDVYARAGW